MTNSNAAKTDNDVWLFLLNMLLRLRQLTQLHLKPRLVVIAALRLGD